MIEDLNNALIILKRGGIILYPTDTIWGIGCDATNEAAVDKIYKIKRRKDVKSMIILLDAVAKIPRYTKDVPQKAYLLAVSAEKPLTIIYPGAHQIARNLVAEDGSIGIRIVKDEFCNTLISRLNKPIVSTSANISGRPWPSHYDSIDLEIRRSVDYTVSWRQKETVAGQPSGIIKLGPDDEPIVIRE